MLESLKQWTVVILAGALAWPVASWLLNAMHTIDGRSGVPIVLAESVVGALIAAIVGAVIFGALSFLVGRVTNRYLGMLTFGLCWLIVSRRSVPTDEMLRFMDTVGRDASSAYLMLALESLLWSAFALTVLLVQLRLSPNQYPRQQNSRSGQSLQAAGVCMVLTLVLTWVFLRTDAKGQTAFGFAAAAALAAMITRMLWPMCNASVLFAAPVVVGLMAPLSAMIINGDEALARQAAGEFWALGRLMPIDVAGGGVFGIALGIAMARTFGPEDHPAMDHRPASGPALVQS